MTADAEKVSRLLRTARGQIDGILRMVEDDRYCVDISNQLLATASILRKANTEVLRSHMYRCVVTSFTSSDELERAKKIEELIGLLDKNTV